RVVCRAIVIGSKNTDCPQVAGGRRRPHGVSIQVYSRNRSVCITIFDVWEESENALPSRLGISRRCYRIADAAALTFVSPIEECALPHDRATQTAAELILY